MALLNTSTEELELAKLAEAEAADEDEDEAELITSVEVPVATLLELHRKLSYCLRGNQRPTVLQIQKEIVALLPEGTPLVYKA